jgi:hypothetical protein
MLRICLILTCLLAFWCSAAAAAVYTEDPSGVTSGEGSFGYSPDEVAVNQGAVIYWYAKGYASAWGDYPVAFGDLTAKNLPLRKFYSPHTGQEIMLDDGTLDFDGDMTYRVGVGDVEVQVQTGNGVVTLPGSIEGQAKCKANTGCPTCCKYAHCDITICGFDCWKCSYDQECICMLTQWILNKSFDLYKCRYGTLPCDEAVWMASGLAPIDRNWRNLQPDMDIQYVMGSCYIKRAKVVCCPPVVKCMSCDKCGGKGCNTCGSSGKCTTCVKPAKCDKCGGKGCTTCNKCSACKGKGCDRCGHGGHNH